MRRNNNFSNCMMDILKYVFLFSLMVVSQVCAEAQTREPSDKLTGKWSGKIQSEMKAFDANGKVSAIGRSSLEILNLSVKEYEKREPSPEELNFAKLSGLAPIVTSFKGWAKFSAQTEFFDSKGKLCERWSLPNKVELIEIDGHFLKDTTISVHSDSEVMMKRELFVVPLPPGVASVTVDEFPAFSMGGAFLFPTRSIKYTLEKGRITINDIWQEGSGEINVTGELYRIDHLKKSFPKDIKPNESIETDKKTRIEITIPNIGKVNIAENTKTKFKSENLLEVVKGKIHGFIKKLKPKTKFDIHTPTCALSVRGTEYALNVEDDGTTTLIVIDGEVEFSDKEKKKTVLVKKNQQSVVKPGELPSEPVQINPDQILKWWE